MMATKLLFFPSPWRCRFGRPKKFFSRVTTFDPNDRALPEVALMLDKIRNSKGHIVALVDKKTLLMTDPHGHKLENVFFYYACGLPEKSQRALAGTARKEIALYQKVRFIFQEQLAAFGVQF
jgi:hypothetical protein